MDPQTRDVIYARIRDMARLYGLFWLLRQETRDAGMVLERLEDDALIALRDLVFRAHDCIVEGVSFDEAGLVKGAPHG